MKKLVRFISVLFVAMSLLVFSFGFLTGCSNLNDDNITNEEETNGGDEENPESNNGVVNTPDLVFPD